MDTFQSLSTPPRRPLSGTLATRHRGGVDVAAVVAAAGADRHGVAYRRELLAAGVSSAGLSRAVAAGSVVRLGRGVYRTGPAGELGEVIAAAAAVHGVVAFDSAARAHGWALVHPPREAAVIVPRHRRVVRRRGIRQHRLDLRPGEVVEISGVPVTSPLRTVLDCGRALALEEAVAIADSALRAGLDHRDLLEAAAYARGPGAAKVRRMAALADPNAASVLESVARVLLSVAGLEPSHTQYVLRDTNGGLIAVADFAYEEQQLLVETDGFEFHRDRHDYRADRRKANAFLLRGWTLLRFSWEDVMHDPDYVLRAVRSALQLRLEAAA